MVIGVKRARQAVRGQHGEHHRKPERREQEFCRSFEEDDGGEHAADRQRRDQRRHGDAGGAVQRRRGSGSPSSVSRRWVFSMVTVESSTRMPTASASPPSVMVLSVSPRK